MKFLIILEHSKYIMDISKKVSDAENFIIKHNIPRLVKQTDTCISKEGLIDKCEWLDENEFEIMNLWDAMSKYLDDSNTFILDNCTFCTFCDFVASNSIRVTKARYEDNDN